MYDFNGERYRGFSTKLCCGGSHLRDLNRCSGSDNCFSPGEGKTAFVRVLEDLYQLDGRFTADPGFASTATGSTQLGEAVVCFN